MTKYRLPDALGGAEVQVLHGPGGGNDPAITVQVDGIGRVTLPALCLVKVEPPIPAEPPPGAYLFGDVLCVRFEGQRWWHWVAPTYGLNRDTFDRLWLALGGPDVKVTPLVPRDLPEVELPHRQQDANGQGISVFLHRLRDAPRIQLGVGGRTYWLFDVQASCLAAALLLAAAGPDTEREA